MWEAGAKITEELHKFPPSDPPPPIAANAKDAGFTETPPAESTRILSDQPSRHLKTAERKLLML